MADEKDFKKPELTELVSFKALQVEGPTLQLDLDEDAWAYGAPPPKGCYEFKWFLAQKGLKSGYDDPKDPNSLFAQCDIEGRLVNNPEWDGISLNEYLTTKNGRGKHINKMAGFIISSGNKPILEKYQKEGKLTVRKLGEIAESLVKKEPTIRAEIDWRGAYSYPNPKGGRDLWKNVANKYEDFPLEDEKVPTGPRKHVFTVTGIDGLPKEIRAQLRVVRFLAKGEVYAPSKVTTVGKVPSAVSAPVLVAQAVELEPSAPSPTLVSQPRPVPVQMEIPVAEVVAVSQADTDDEMLMLDGE